jgi:hypothetical protein
MNKRRMGLWMSILPLLLILAAPGSVLADSMAQEGGVWFELTDVTGIFVAGTKAESTPEEAIIPCRWRFTGEELPGHNVTMMGLTVTFDESLLEFQDASLDGFGTADPYWPGIMTVDDHVPGKVVILLEDLSGVGVPATADLTEFVWLKFTPLCQPELSIIPVTIEEGLSITYIVAGEMYYVAENDVDDGSVQVAEYDGYVSVIDPNPLDEEEVRITKQGVVGTSTQIEVPYYIETNYNVHRARFVAEYDTTKVVPVGFQLADDWYWTYGAPPMPQAGHFFVDAAAVPTWLDDNSEPLAFLIVTYEIIGDWHGQDTVIGFLEGWDNTVIVGYRDGGICYDLTYPPNAEFYGGTVEIEDYLAAYNTVIDDMIYPADISAGHKLFWATAQLQNNFIGEDPEASPIRLDYDLGYDFDVIDVDQPEDFWFEVNTSSAKSLPQHMELYMVPRDGLLNERPISPEFADLVRFQLLLSGIEPPDAYGADGYSFAYMCDFGEREARVVDAPTDSITADCGNENLTFGDTPQIRYAVGELYCPQATSTSPANVTQTYYIRNSIEVSDFEVTIRKDGRHGIVDISPAAGVEVRDHDDDYVTFGAGPDWAPSVNDERLAIGTIIYSAFYVPADENEITGGEDKDIHPGPTYCWWWTAITFDGNSYLADAQGRRPYMFVQAGSVGTKYLCGGPIDPHPEPHPTPDGQQVTQYRLYGNWPNPFNPMTTISFDLPHMEHVTLEILNVKGQRVRMLVDEVRSTGHHEVSWNGTDQAGRRVASGTYLYVLKAGDFRQTARMILLK